MVAELEEPWSSGLALLERILASTLRLGKTDKRPTTVAGVEWPPQAGDSFRAALKLLRAPKYAADFSDRECEDFLTADVTDGFRNLRASVSVQFVPLQVEIFASREDFLVVLVLVLDFPFSIATTRTKDEDDYGGSALPRWAIRGRVERS
jgi:hypothetical protein